MGTAQGAALDHEEETAGTGGDGGKVPLSTGVAGDEDDGARRAAARARVVARARELDDTADPEAVRAVLALAVARGLPPGDLAYVMAELNGAAKVGQGVLKLWLTDIQCSVAGARVIHTRDKLSRELERELRHGREDIVWAEGTLWVHTADGVGEQVRLCGHYVRVGQGEIDALLLAAFPEHPLVATAAGRREVIERMIARIKVDPRMEDGRFFEGAKSGLNMLNGLVHYDEATRRAVLLPPAPEHRARHRLPVPHVASAEAPRAIAGLAQVIREPSRLRSFQEFLGCFLLQVTPGRDGARHGLLLIGPQNSGKSTVTEVFRLAVPAEAISEIPPDRWSSDYHRAVLAGKRLNVVAELSDRRVISGDRAKAILGLDRVDARLPYQEPFSFRPMAWHVFAANKPPRTDDADPAFARRFLAIRFDRSLSREEIDPEFLAKVSAELPGLINWAIEGALRAMARGYFELPDGHDGIIAEIQHGDDLVTRFVLAEVERAGDRPGVSTTALFEALKGYAEANGEDTSEWKELTHRRKIAAALRAIHGAGRFLVSGKPHFSHVRLRPRPGAE